MVCNLLISSSFLLDMDLRVLLDFSDLRERYSDLSNSDCSGLDLREGVYFYLLRDFVEGLARLFRL